MTQGQIIYDNPIGPTRPTNTGAGFDFFGTVKDTFTGAFNFGLEYLSDQLAFERQKDMFEWQQKVNGYADTTNVTGGGQPNPYNQSYGLGAFNINNMSPVVIAALGVLAILLVKK